MTQEEKAKAYDEAIEKGKQIQNTPYTAHWDIMKDVAEYLLPELKESDDEKVRKALKEYFINSFQNNGVAAICGVHIKNILAFLEKQGEQNLANSAITFNDAHIIDSALNDYCCKKYNALHKENGGVLSFARLQHLAMDIYGWCKKQGEQNLANSAKTCKDEQNPNPCDGCVNRKGCINCENGELREVEQKPAEIVKWSPQEENCICQLESLVKEQWRQAEKVHDSVNIKKMSELMFFLKTLNPNKKPQRIISAEVKEVMYDKPTWSEDDKDIIEWLIGYLEYQIMNATITEEKNNCLNAISMLKFLKDRYIWKPSEEQMGVIAQSVAVLKVSGYGELGDRLGDISEQLNKLKE